MGFTWIDIVVLAILLLYSIEGYALGALPALFDVIQFTASFFLGLRGYSLISPWLVSKFSLPTGIANTIGFFLIAFFSEFLIGFFLRWYLSKILQHNFLQKPELRKFNHILGTLPGLLSGLVLVMFVITVVVSLPLSPFLRKAIANGRISSVLLGKSQLIEKQVSQVFGKAATDTLNFLTVEPESNATVALRFTYTNGTVDIQAEGEMVQMVNQERKRVGLKDLTADIALTKLARDHAQDMLQRGYFSHYTPEGLSPFDRMNIAGISYTAAGENLALSPNVELAMQGLMQSPGHRANILSKDFGKVGIGVIDAGIYGEMFVQEFTN